jgi:DNA polymerase I
MCTRIDQHLKEFREIWVVDFHSKRPPGERATPNSLTATECRSGRRVLLEGGEFPPCPPYPVSPDVLFVSYDAPAQLGCHLALAWPLPARILDLQAEFRWLTSGLDLEEHGFPQALAYFGVSDGPDALVKLLDAMLPQLDLPRAFLRGRYTAAVARMEDLGVPLDMENLTRLRDGWDRVQDALIERVDRHYGVFDGRKFQPRRWGTWLNRHGIRWPRTAPDRLDLRLETFRDMALACPVVGPMHQLRASLSQLRLFQLAVGRDGRNRTPLRPFASKTGRNQPSTSRFIFGPAAWLRGLIQPPEGMALAYIDYEQQEFGIAAALSRDEAMMAAYRSGDPYLTFARQAGGVPQDATKATHPEERDRFKACALGVQYGMGPKSLAARLAIPAAQAQDLLRLHRRTYQAYWQWSRQVGRQARKEAKLTAAYGWRLNVPPGANIRSVKNFPLQANGAEMLRLACCALTEDGIRVCAPVHDALLIEAPIEDIDHITALCEQAMRQASEAVLQGFPLRTDHTVTHYPDNYPIGPERQRMWDTVNGLLRTSTTRVAQAG